MLYANQIYWLDQKIFLSFPRLAFLDHWNYVIRVVRQLLADCTSVSAMSAFNSCYMPITQCGSVLAISIAFAVLQTRRKEWKHLSEGLQSLFSIFSQCLQPVMSRDTHNGMWSAPHQYESASNETSRALRIRSSRVPSVCVLAPFLERHSLSIAYCIMLSPFESGRLQFE